MRYNEQRVYTYKKWWDDLVSMYGHLCFYCRKDIAATIDHVVPYSWDQDNFIDNLVPACSLCNCIAGNKIFDNVDLKRIYIVKHREKYKNKRAICAECLLPYSYRIHSPSLFLCASCYDQEYDTDYANRKQWETWILELFDAGIIASAHESTRKTTGKFTPTNRDPFMAKLIDNYSQVAGSDERFFYSLAGA